MCVLIEIRTLRIISEPVLVIRKPNLFLGLSMPSQIEPPALKLFARVLLLLARLPLLLLKPELFGAGTVQVAKLELTNVVAPARVSGRDQAGELLPELVQSHGEVVKVVVLCGVGWLGNHSPELD